MDKIRLSPYHKIFYNEWKLDSESSKYNIVFDQTICSTLNIPRLKNGLNQFISNYLLFNSHIIEDGGELFWVENPAISDLEHFKSGYSSQAIFNYIAKPFNLESGPLYRFAIFNDKDGNYRFIIVLHHLLIDGASGNQFIKEISACYNNIEYKSKIDYANQIKSLDLMVNGTYNRLKRYSETNSKFWSELLFEVEPVDLRFIKSSIKSSDITPIKELRFSFTKHVESKINELNSKYGLSLFQYSQMIFAILIYRYTGQEKFAISYPIMIKEYTDLVYGVGVNTNIFPYHINNKTTISDLIYLMVRLKAPIYRHSRLPINNIIQGNDNSLLNVTFGQTNLKDTKFNFDNVVIKTINHEFNIDVSAKLMIEQELNNHNLNFRVRYHESEVDDLILRNFIKHYKKLFLDVLGDLSLSRLSRLVNSYTILDSKEYKQIVYDWNNTGSAYPKDKTIHQLFEEQVEKTPDNIAVVYEDKALSYRELNQRSNQLAHYITKVYNINPDDLILLCLDNSEYLLITILAILKSRAAYIPIDPHCPKERLFYIANSSTSPILITSKVYLDRLRCHIDVDSILLMAVDDKRIQSELLRESINNPCSMVTSNNLAYVMYTSGTTGVPNGVMIEHRNVINFIYGLPFNNKGYLKSLFTAPYFFDVSVFDIWSNLLYGHCIYMIDPCTLSSEQQFHQFIINNQINKLYLPASLLKLHKTILSKSSTICQLLTGVETIYSNDVIDLFNIKEIVNAYGPTETTVCATTYIVDVSRYNVYSNKKLLIGKPMPNIVCYILDTSLKLVPKGAIGELYIGGDGVSRGYFNNKELTSLKFINNPFLHISDKILGRDNKLYKTGDLVRMMMDGNIEYIGRIDSQIKHNGFRIEPKEVETSLCKYKGIKQSVVLLINDENNLYKNKHSEEKKSYISTINITNQQNNLEDNEVGMLPIQDWFFAQNFADINHWNQSFLIKIPSLNVEILKNSFIHLVNSHECFRFRYISSVSGNKLITHKQHEIDDTTNEAIFPHFYELDINTIPSKEGSAIFNDQLFQILTDWQSNFNVENGVIASFGYIYGYQDGSSRIYVALHHLVIDMVSWHIILHDLRRIYMELSLMSKNSGIPQIPSKLNVNYTSYKQWIRVVKSYAISNIGERAYWLDVLSDHKDFDNQLNSYIEAVDCNSSILFNMDEYVTEQLINKSNGVFNAQINILLLVTFAISIKNLLTKNTTRDSEISNKVYITLEGHGRENIAPNVDVSHTIGWFTTMFPVKLEIIDDLVPLLQAAKNTVDNVPNSGIGYGALFGYIRDLPRVRFNYLGRLNNSGHNDSWYIINEFSGKNINDKNKNHNVMDMNCWIIDNKLTFNIISQFSEVRLNQFVDDFKTQLITITKTPDSIYRNYLDDKKLTNSQNRLNYDIKNKKHLVAYYVADNELNSVELSKYLSELLPHYSIPQIFIHLDAIPLTPNGKLDITALNKSFNAMNNDGTYIEANNEKEQLICSAFATVLDKRLIGINDNFFAIGGDSISAITLVMRLQDHFKVSVHDIFTYKTPYHLAENLAFSNNSIKNKLLEIMHNHENKNLVRKDNLLTVNKNLKSYMSEIKTIVPNISDKNITNVLLTGATGYLGCNILNQLLTNTNYNIYVPVRAESDTLAVERLQYKYQRYFFESLNDYIGTRVLVICSDIEQVNLGMKVADYDKLTQDIDSIIHSAALIKQVGDRSAFYSANVQATINLLEFAKLTQLKDFHYISTTSLLKHNTIGLENWGNCYTERDLPEELELLENNIYLKTKLEAEQIIVQYRDSLNTNIYRVGNLAFMVANSVVPENIENIGFVHWLRYMFQSKMCMPDMELNLSPADLTANAIVKLFDKECSTNKIYHVFNPYSFDLSYYFKTNIRLSGKIEPIASFIKYIINDLENTKDSNLILRFLLANGWLWVEGFYQFAQNEYLQTETEHILKYLNFKWDLITNEQFEKYLDIIFKGK